VLYNFVRRISVCAMLFVAGCGPTNTISPTTQISSDTQMAYVLFGVDYPEESGVVTGWAFAWLRRADDVTTDALGLHDSLDVVEGGAHSNQAGVDVNGTTYFFREVRPGDYSFWTSVRIRSGSVPVIVKSDDPDFMRFRAEPGVVTYVGTVQLTRNDQFAVIPYSVVDDRAEALVHLANTYDVPLGSVAEIVEIDRTMVLVPE